MNVLVVFAHPKQESFNRSVLNVAVDELKAAGHEVKVADLYAEGFQSAMIEEDFAQFNEQPMPEAVKREQARVEWSDAIVFVFPYWWWSMPAILKGWFDRVFTYGWAWLNPAKPELSPLAPRRVLVLTSAGASAEELAKRDYDKAFFTQLKTGIFGYCNFPEVTIKFLHDVYPGCDQAVSALRLEEAKAEIRKFAR